MNFRRLDGDVEILRNQKIDNIDILAIKNSSRDTLIRSTLPKSFCTFIFSYQSSDFFCQGFKPQLSAARRSFRIRYFKYRKHLVNANIERISDRKLSFSLGRP